MVGGPEPGWYQDPDGAGRRYWDGDRWTDHRLAAESTPASSRSMPGDFWAMLAAVVAVGIGSVGPWVSNPLISVGGLDGDGWITLILAAFGAVALYRAYNADPVQLTGWGAPIAGVIAAGVGIYDAVQIEDASNTAIFGQNVDVANPGWGLYLVIAGGIAMVVIGWRLRPGRDG